MVLAVCLRWIVCCYVLIVLNCIDSLFVLFCWFGVLIVFWMVFLVCCLLFLTIVALLVCVVCASVARLLADFGVWWAGL